MAQARRAWFWAWVAIAVLLTLFAIYWAAFQGTGTGIPGGWARDDPYLRGAAVRFATVVAAVPLAIAIGLNGAPPQASRRPLWTVGVAALAGAGIAIALTTNGSQPFVLGIGAGLGRALLIGAMGFGAVAAARSASARVGVPRALGYVVAGAAGLVCGLHLVSAAITSLSPTL